MNDKLAFGIFVALGFAMCSMGMKIPEYGWLNPFTILGIILGIIALFLIIAAFIGIKLPYLNSMHDYYIAMLGIIMITAIIALIRDMVKIN